MPTDSKMTQLISDLTRWTVHGQIDWAAAIPPDLLVVATNDNVPLYYETNYKRQLIGLAQRRFQNYSGDLDRLFWDERIVLVLLNEHRHVLWEYMEQASALFNLFSVVREKSADVDGIINRLTSG